MLEGVLRREQLPPPQEDCARQSQAVSLLDLRQRNSDEGRHEEARVGQKTHGGCGGNEEIGDAERFRR